MEVLISLDLIDPNPWQARESEDRQHVWEIAQSIASQGLMQAPAGRKVGDRVQLAFGNTRLAAFKMLNEQAYEKAEYARMPVLLVDLTDQEMFERGIEENVARKNLTPIEEAKAMLRYRDDFGKTSEEIGKLFHMGDSGVRNKMRLLKLPQDIQDCLRQGLMPEGVARELLAIAELPEDIRLAAEDDDGYAKPSEIIEAAKSGAGQKGIADMVRGFMEHIGKRQPKPAPQPAPIPPPTPPPPLATFQPSRPASVTYTAPSTPQPAGEFFEKSAEAAAQVFGQQPAPAAEAADSVSTETVTVGSQTVNASTGEVLASEDNPPVPEAPAASWETSSITVTLSYWPHDGDEAGRLVMVGVRVDQKTPTMRMFRESQLVLPEQVADLLEDEKSKLGGA